MISKVTSLTPVAGIGEVGDVAGISEWPFTIFYYRNNLRSKNTSAEYSDV